MPVLALNLHAGFECRHSGACCTAGWPIPVEPGVADAVRAPGVFPGLALSTAGPLPDGAAAILEPRPGGACPAFDQTGGNLCTIQARLGHGALPASCRHFPRVALLEPDAVRVTLSHFCPTAAWMLFSRDTGGLAVVGDAAGIADRREHDGFDARQTIPPFLRPGVVMDSRTCRRWEQYMLGVLDSADMTPEHALARAALTADRIRSWPPGPESLDSHCHAEILGAGALHRNGVQWNMPLASACRLFQLAADSVPPGLSRPLVPDGAEAADSAWVRPRWAALSGPIRRYLAARFFGSWCAYLGEGLRTQVAMLAIALDAVRIEAVREASRASRPLDERLLHGAIRSADLLLHHLSDLPALVKSLAGVEQGPAPAFLEAIGLEAAR
jgi:hypothetical protein